MRMTSIKNLVLIDKTAKKIGGNNSFIVPSMLIL